MSSVTDTKLLEDLGLQRNLTPERKTELGQQEFLELMITQLRSQDPFKPMESGDFLGQLAQFGTVSGIDSLESRFSELSASLTSNQALQAANLVGSQVLVATDKAPLVEGQAFSGAVDLPFAADQVKVEVLDGSGSLVHTVELGAQEAGFASFSWTGIDSEGKPVGSGVYELRAEARSGPVTQAVETAMNTTVENVRLGRVGEPLGVRVGGLGDVDFDDIIQIG